MTDDDPLTFRLARDKINKANENCIVRRPVATVKGNNQITKC
jgi:hypothetical protein